MSTIKIILSGEFEIVEDGGHYRNDNMEKIRELVEKTVKSYTILVQQGAMEPKSVPARLRVSKITYQVYE